MCVGVHVVALDANGAQGFKQIGKYICVMRERMRCAQIIL